MLVTIGQLGLSHLLISLPSTDHRCTKDVIIIAVDSLNLHLYYFNSMFYLHCVAVYLLYWASFRNGTCFFLPNFAYVLVCLRVLNLPAWVCLSETLQMFNLWRLEAVMGMCKERKKIR